MRQRALADGMVEDPPTVQRYLRTARVQSGGVVNWQITQVHEWTPGDPGGPHAAP